jgi:endoglucanase
MKSSNSLSKLGQSWSRWICFLALAVTPSAIRSQAVTGVGQAAVRDNHFIRDGKPWIPHGFQQIAFAVAPGAFGTAPAIFRIAAENFSPQEYSDMKAHGGDAVRIQVAQNGFDPQGINFDPKFQENVIGAIHSARQAGLTVIVSIQNEPQTGEKQKPTELPDEATERVWCHLAPPFAHDRGVIFEIYNEPRIRPMPPQGPSVEQWKAWAAAMNRLIGLIRSLGAENVVVADGLQRAETLNGAPHLEDRLHQVVYASHPYAHSSEDQDEPAWKSKFGDYSMDAPVLISEWGIGYYCDIKTSKQTERFLDYLQRHRIGLVIVTWDWSSATFGSFNYGFPQPQISNFQGVCTPPKTIPAGFGVGKMVERWYQTGSPKIPGAH